MKQGREVMPLMTKIQGLPLRFEFWIQEGVGLGLALSCDGSVDYTSDSQPRGLGFKPACHRSCAFRQGT